MKQKVSFLLACILIFASVVGVYAKENANLKNLSNNEHIIIRVSHVLPENHASHRSLVLFKELVDKRSNGRIEVQIYPNSQLGGDRQAIESVSLGSLQMTMPGGPVLSGFEEKFMVLDLPFLFKSKEIGYNALDGEFGQELNKLLYKHNIMNLGFAENGFRHITNNVRPIHKPEDLEGIKIRTMENPVHIAAFKAFGANPTPMNFGELFTALQQKTVDAQDNPTSIIYTSRFYEVQKYMTLSGHVFGNAVYLINKSFYDSLSPEDQKIVSESMDEAKAYQRKLAGEQEVEFLKELEKEGMVINELTPEEKDLFIEAAAPVYKQLEKKLGKDLIEKAMSYNNK